MSNENLSNRVYSDRTIMHIQKLCEGLMTNGIVGLAQGYILMDTAISMANEYYTKLEANRMQNCRRPTTNASAFVYLSGIANTKKLSEETVGRVTSGLFNNQGSQITDASKEIVQVLRPESNVENFRDRKKVEKVLTYQVIVKPDE